MAADNPSDCRCGGISLDIGKRDSHKGYRASYLARKHSLTLDQARNLITRIGHDRLKLNAAAQRLAGRSSVVD
jgi:hypothetical protein